MAILFGRQVSLTIAQAPPAPGASTATVNAVKAEVEAAGFLFPTEAQADATAARLTSIQGGLAGTGVGGSLTNQVWQFSETEWGVITPAQASRLLERGKTPNAEGKTFRELRVSFKVKKTSDGKPNKADIQVFNPNPDTVALVQDRNVVVRLFAGYSFPWMLFTGSPIKDGINIERGGPERVLRIEAQDGGQKLTATRLELNFATNTTLKQVLNAVATDSGLGVGFVDDVDDFDFPQGIQIEGSPKAVLERIAQISGADFSIQDGSIQIVKQQNDTGEDAVLLSVKNGNLIKVARKEKGRVALTSMLEGSIRPGRRFVIESELINGIFKAIDVEHKGDIYDSTFTTQVTARPWKEPSPAAGEGTVASIKAALIAAGLMFSNQAEATAYAERLAAIQGGLAGTGVGGSLTALVAKFSDTEWGVVTPAQAATLQEKGIFSYEVGFQGPIQ